MNHDSLSYMNGTIRKDTMQKIIYRGYEILDDEKSKSYIVYGNNDELVRQYLKDEAKLEDVYKHIDKMKKE